MKFIELHQHPDGDSFYLRKKEIQLIERGTHGQQRCTLVWGHRLGTRYVTEDPQRIIKELEGDDENPV